MVTKAQPIACTLSGKKFATAAHGLLIWHETLLSQQRGGLALRRRYKPDVLSRVRQMVRPLRLHPAA